MKQKHIGYLSDLNISEIHQKYIRNEAETYREPLRFTVSQRSIKNISEMKQKHIGNLSDLSISEIHQKYIRNEAETYRESLRFKYLRNPSKIYPK